MSIFGKLFGNKSDRPKPSDKEQLVIMPVPALVAVLLHHENEKGVPLTEAEVLEIRDKAVCMATPISVVAKLAEARGYDDIDPENAWQEWVAIRSTLPHEGKPS